MRRVAAVYDIHGNLPALSAVLEDIRDAGVDQVVVGGDVVPGPMQKEVLSRLLEIDLPVQFIRGNCEVAVLKARAGDDPGPMPEQAREIIRWSAEQLDDAIERLFANWPKTVSADIEGIGEVLFCHGTPRDENEIFVRTTAEDRLLPAFDGVSASVVVCGHTHMQFDRMVGRVRVVNAGSVGMPFGEPGAYWLVLGPGIELRHTDYDLDKAADLIRGSKYPQAEAFAAQNVLHPPSEAKMLEAFARAELK